MQEQFEVAAGSVVGTTHRRIGKNNQDAYQIAITKGAIAAVVCDGCGSSPHSEVGAKLGAKWFIKALMHSPDRIAWNWVQQQVLAQMQAVAQSMDADWKQVVRDYFLFTAVGVVITEELTTLFAVGDGVIALNECLLPLPAFPGNAPPYLAYGLFGTSGDWWHIQLQKQIPTAEVESILIGSDGVEDLMAMRDRNIPGQAKPVGDIHQFWRKDRYFQNPDAVRRQLFLLNREILQHDWQRQRLIKQGGLLPDDTTLVALRRRKSVGAIDPP